jgi:hypothetical protein
MHCERAGRTCLMHAIGARKVRQSEPAGGTSARALSAIITLSERKTRARRYRAARGQGGSNSGSKIFIRQPITQQIQHHAMAVAPVRQSGSSRPRLRSGGGVALDLGSALKATRGVNSRSRAPAGALSTRLPSDYPQPRFFGGLEIFWPRLSTVTPRVRRFAFTADCNDAGKSDLLRV